MRQSMPELLNGNAISALEDLGQPSNGSTSTIVTASPASFELGRKTVPIMPSWVLGGSPLTRSKNVTRSHDWTSNVLVWECTAGEFQWHYNKEEVVVITSGEVCITINQGEERWLGPGDLAVFPAGTSAIWRVPSHVRKVAVLRETMWRPLGFCLKAWKTLLRKAGIGGPSPL
jgi:uncharacterized protein